MSRIQATNSFGGVPWSADHAAGLPVPALITQGLFDEPAAAIPVSARTHFEDHFFTRAQADARTGHEALIPHSRFAIQKIAASFLLRGNELHRFFADTLFNSNLIIQTQVTNRED